MSPECWPNKACMFFSLKIIFFGLGSSYSGVYQGDHVSIRVNHRHGFEDFCCNVQWTEQMLCKNSHSPSLQLYGRLAMCAEMDRLLLSRVHHTALCIHDCWNLLPEALLLFRATSVWRRINCSSEFSRHSLTKDKRLSSSSRVQFPLRDTVITSMVEFNAPAIDRAGFRKTSNVFLKTVEPASWRGSPWAGRSTQCPRNRPSSAAGSWSVGSSPCSVGFA